ncbi:MAG TPA: LCP family protein [Micromonosporaceae bacterium]|jgi:LCP family protein required for cell wall assembly
MTTARRAPLWARLCAIIGVLLMLGSGGLLATKQLLLARYAGAVQTADLFGDSANAPQPGSDIHGPLNILLVGVDTRVSKPGWLPNADSIMVLHVSKNLDEAYLFSIPRDLVVTIPAFAKAGFAGERTKINAAMAYGSRVAGSSTVDAAQGFQLLAQTVSQYTGIERFDAGAIINFGGFKRIVDAMGGVDMYIDERVASIHLKPDGTPRPNSGPNGTGPQKVYEKGWAHLSGWEALDYTRQRYIPGSDYARQRHQQQFLRAMAQKATSLGVITNPLKLDAVLRAAGNALIFSGRGHSIVDFVFALKGLRSSSLMTIRLPGQSVYENGAYRGERLLPVAQEVFAALRAERLGTFMAGHPELINGEHAPPQGN